VPLAVAGLFLTKVDLSYEQRAFDFQVADTVAGFACDAASDCRRVVR